MEPLTTALKTERPVVRKMAALVLGDLAPEMRGAIPALAAALGDADEGVRRRAAAALGQYGAGSDGGRAGLRRRCATPTGASAASRRRPWR